MGRLKDWLITIIVGAVTLPFAIYLLGNLYVYLFDSWQLNSNKMWAASLGLITGLGILIIERIRNE